MTFVLTETLSAVRYKKTDRDLRPEQISALVLEKLKQAAEKTYDASIEGAVITVPAYFTDSQRQATKTAGIVAGLKVYQRLARMNWFWNHEEIAIK